MALLFIYIIILREKISRWWEKDIIKVTIRVEMNKDMWENVQERQSKMKNEPILYWDWISEKNDEREKNWIIIIIIIRMMYEHGGVWMCMHTFKACPCMFVKRFQSLFYISFFLITCVHLTYRHMYVIGIWKRERERKRESRFTTIILIFFPHNIKTDHVKQI